MYPKKRNLKARVERYKLTHANGRGDQPWTPAARGWGFTT